ncbi:MAG: hypothetical protein WCZ89_07035 [Phycisphaerae bacterium]
MSRTLIVCIFSVLIFISTGCSKKKSDASGTAAKPSEQTAVNQQQSSQTIQKISDNPGFFTVSAVSPKSAEVKDLDKLLRPILIELFEDAKLVEQSETPETRADGEVIKNKMVYVVRMILTPQEGDNLHAALTAKGFAASPRMGRKPLHYKSTVTMTVMKTTSLGGYSLNIIVDANKQQIEIISYQLGSKYDQML